MFGDLKLRTIALGTASQTALRNCFEEVEEEPGYVQNFFGWKYIQSSIHLGKRFLLITHKKTQIPQVNDFNAFLYTGRCKNPRASKIFLRYAS